MVDRAPVSNYNTLVCFPAYRIFFFFVTLLDVILFAEDLHNLPISQMGNYQEYIKSLEAVGRGPLREVEPQAIRVHAFGNPFKIDKVCSLDIILREKSGVKF